MKNFFLAALIIVTLFTSYSCKKNDNSTPTAASVLFVNGCAGSVNTDVTVNGTKVAAASNLAFLKNSGYQAVQAGSNVSIVYSLTATGTPLITDNETLTAGLHYSSFTGGLVTGTSTVTVFTTDDLTSPPSGMAKVRFVNLSSDNLTTGCYIGTAKIDSNVGFKTCTPFFNVNAGTAKVSMIDQSVPVNSAMISNQILIAGKIYTFMLTGTSSATAPSTSVLTLTAINNN